MSSQSSSTVHNSTNLSAAESTKETEKNKFGLSVLQQYREVGFLQDSTDCQLLWDFIACPSRVFRISIPKQQDYVNKPSDWIHFKIYRQSIEQMSLHQIILLSVNEARTLLVHLPSILQTVKESFYSFDHNSQRLEDQDYTTITPTQDQLLVDKFWRFAKVPGEKLVLVVFIMIRKTLTGPT